MGELRNLRNVFWESCAGKTPPKHLSLSEERWDAARAEIAAAMGVPESLVLSDREYSSKGYENFLYKGIPVIRE